MLMKEVDRRLAASHGGVKHLVVLLPVPIVYPKIPVTESVLAAISSKRRHTRTHLTHIVHCNDIAFVCARGYTYCKRALNKHRRLFTQKAKAGSRARLSQSVQTGCQTD